MPIFAFTFSSQAIECTSSDGHGRFCKRLRTFNSTGSIYYMKRVLKVEITFIPFILFYLISMLKRVKHNKNAAYQYEKYCYC